MPFPRKFSDLCTPASVYFVISIIVYAIMVVQNFGRTNTFLLGNTTFPVPSTALVFALKLIYILFWTWILNLICSDGHKGIAWFLVLMPFIVLFMSLLAAPHLLVR
jgi:hypothetical protein